MNAPKSNQLFRPITAVCVAAALVGLLASCQPAVECGTWAFGDTPNGDSYGISSSFTFNPAACGQNCSCDVDCIIQMTWVYDVDSHTYILDHADEGNGSVKATTDNWEIDQWDTWGYAYYGLQNNGVFANGFNNPGGNGVATTLNDGPGGYGPSTLFFALDVAVCYNSKTCQNKILGSYFWAFTTDTNSNTAPVANVTGWTGIESEFQDAVTVWNTKWVPFSTTIVINDGTKTLPSAVPLPTLTDL